MTDITDPGQGQAGVNSRSSGTSASSSSGGGNPRRARRTMSMVEDVGVYDSSCGYCKSRSGSRNFTSRGLWAHTLTVQDYQDLLDRGWRRSGMFLYKPCMKVTCCPPYTIRLKVDQFVAAKDQMRVLRRMQRYLDGSYNGPQTVGDLQEEKDSIDERDGGLSLDSVVASSSDETPSVVERVVAVESGVREKEKLISSLKDAIKLSVTKCAEKGLLPLNLDFPEPSVKPITQKVKGKMSTESKADYTCNIAFPLAAAVKRRKNSGGEDAGGADIHQWNLLLSTPQEVAENLVILLTELSIPGVSSVKACKGHLNFVLTDVIMLSPEPPRVESLANGETTGSEELGEVVEGTSTGSTRQLEIRMARSSFIEEEFALYKKYQIHIHKDRPEDVRDTSYKKFLVDSPLTFVPPANDGTTPSCGFGSFHQQYRLDGKLIAVGVVDILPYCLSSKYLFWDPDFAFLSLGKYSALKEIAWVQKEQTVCPSLQFYYLGFYIHSCPKMRYKAAYHPSELLCPERYRWVSYELARTALEERPYVCLSDLTTTSKGIEHCEDSRGHQGSTDRHSNGVEVQLPSNELAGNLEERNGAVADQPSLDMSAVVDEILLYLRGARLLYKHLREIQTLPRHQLEEIASNLQMYAEDVGSPLAMRMLYVLS
ncbi:hypothetical protein R1sor_023273 [Riccia sorocarpa]|uniref:arginyltransferase n=1 Tax=Riccia sorocarpa TaxID=122646 RepID=A0ABD3GQ69_9MARC